MKLQRPLPQSFFARPCLAVAPELVGALFVRVLSDGTRLVGRIVEVEAYLGDGSDASSHAHRGPTERNRSMFGPPGRLYAYRSYGVHTCLNFVCEPAGRGAAVLLRALEPVEGVDRMRAHRKLPKRASDVLIASGPGRVAQALALGCQHDGRSVLSGELTVRPPPGEVGPTVNRSPRIGISKGTDLPFRFTEKGSRWLSRRV